MTSKTMVALVMAGGEGSRLRPLTCHESKPALRFAQGYRLIDFVLGNLVNSGVEQIYVLAQYKPATLIAHIESEWGSHPHASINVLLSQRDDGYQGTADAVLQNLQVVRRHRPALVGVFAADHVYRMDVRQMAAYHQRKGATITVAAVPVPIAAATAFGILAADGQGRVTAFEEKPRQPTPMPGEPTLAYASMGNYLFEPQTLETLLDRMRCEGGTDFGHHVLPNTPGREPVYAYDLATNTVPGLREFEDRAYWRDAGTVEALEEARSDAKGAYPRFCLDNPKWPLHGRVMRTPAIEPASAGLKVNPFQSRI